MDSLNFELVSPERVVFSGEVQMVTMPGSEGEMGILPKHAPLLASLRPGVVTVDQKNGSSKRFFVCDSFAEISQSSLTILSEIIIPMEEINKEVLAQQIKDAEEDLADASDIEQRQHATENLEHLRSLRSAL